MRLFVVTDNGAAIGEFVTREDLEARLRQDWDEVPSVIVLDQALLATIDVSHVGQVIEWRRGWVFCAADAPA